MATSDRAVGTEDEVPSTSDGAGPADTDGGDDSPRRVKFPTALTVLAIVLLVVWLASFFIPSGRYEIDPETGSPIPGSYQELPECGDAAEGEDCVDKGIRSQFGLLWRAPHDRQRDVNRGAPSFERRHRDNR